MTTLREAAQQALEALEAAEFHAKRRTPDASIEVAVQPAITALRAALAEQAEQQCEYCKRGLKAGVCYCKPAEQEAVAAQHRFRRPEKGTPDWSVWQPCKINNKRPAREIDSQGYQVEYRALYTAPQPTAVPAGYALVPVEPTEAMLNAARDWSLKKYGQAVGNDGARGCYAAMLAAAIRQLKDKT